MSAQFYKDAACDAIKTALNLDYKAVAVMGDGKPEPRCGEFFCSIWGDDEREQGGGESIDEYFEFTATLTQRFNVPFDKVGKSLLQKATTGLLARARVVGLAIHMNYTVMNAANTALWAATALNVGGFIEPARMKVGRVRWVYSDWFHSDKGGECGLACDVTLNLARRIQTIGSAS